MKEADYKEEGPGSLTEWLHYRAEREHGLRQDPQKMYRTWELAVTESEPCRR